MKRELDFSILDSFRYAFTAYKDNLKLFLTAYLFYWIVTGLNTWLMPLTEKMPPVLYNYPLGNDQYFHITLANTITFLIAVIVGSFILVGFIKIILRIYDNEETGTYDLFNNKHLILTYISANILLYCYVGLPIIASYFIMRANEVFGLILFPFAIVISIRQLLKLMFAPYILVDMEISPIEALKESANITRGIKMDLFGFLMLLFAINVPALIIILLLGDNLISQFVSSLLSFITYPVMTIAYIYLLRKLLDRDENKILNDQHNIVL